MDSRQSDIVASVQIAQASLEEANQRRKVAIDAVVDFALRAVIAGEDLETVMEACGFQDEANAPQGLAALLGLGFGGSRRQRFAQWLGQSLCERIMEES